MLNHSRTSRLQLRRTHAARTAAHRLHRHDGPESSALLLLARQAHAAAARPASTPARAASAAAKNVIMVFLQGGPSHIDIWDPKPDAPSNIRGEFKPIKTKIPGTLISEHMPMMAQHLDKATLIRSMSYTPNGLFNHTAAIYQMLTGYPPDKVSPSGQLEPPIAADFPTAGQSCVEAEAADRAGAAVRRTAAPAAGIRHHRQRRQPPASWARPTIRIACIRTRPSRSSSKICRCARTSRRSA